MIPKETISVVAPAGGWLTRSKTINAPVDANERDAAITRGQYTKWNASRAFGVPVIQKAPYPQSNQIAWPRIAFRGLDEVPSGAKKKR